jgi:hypothetical protein
MAENRCVTIIMHKCTRNPSKECDNFVAKRGDFSKCVDLIYNNACGNEEAIKKADEKFEQEKKA